MKFEPTHKCKSIACEAIRIEAKSHSCKLPSASILIRIWNIPLQTLNWSFFPFWHLHSANANFSCFICQTDTDKYENYDNLMEKYGISFASMYCMPMCSQKMCLSILEPIGNFDFDVRIWFFFSRSHFLFVPIRCYSLVKWWIHWNCFCVQALHDDSMPVWNLSFRCKREENGNLSKEKETKIAKKEEKRTKRSIKREKSEKERERARMSEKTYVSST